MAAGGAAMAAGGAAMAAGGVGMAAGGVEMEEPSSAPTARSWGTRRVIAGPSGTASPGLCWHAERRTPRPDQTPGSGTPVLGSTPHLDETS